MKYLTIIFSGCFIILMSGCSNDRDSIVSPGTSYNNPIPIIESGEHIIYEGQALYITDLEIVIHFTYNQEINIYYWDDEYYGYYETLYISEINYPFNYELLGKMKKIVFLEEYTLNNIIHVKFTIEYFGVL